MTLPSSQQRRCGDCLAVVNGIYCPQCGQKQKSPVRHFGQLAGEFFNDVLNLDTRLLDTLKVLLLSPGRLSNEYFADRRTRYISPIKLYFLLSIVTFFLIQQNLEILTGEKTTLSSIEPGAAKAFGDDMYSAIGDIKAAPIAANGLPDGAKDLLHERLSRLEKILGNKDWTQLLRTGLAAAPQALLVLLPLFALLLKIVYLFDRRLYMEHLIIALHNHAFVLLTISLDTVLWWMSDWVSSNWWQSLTVLFSSLLGLWVPAYLLIGLKRTYRQSWKMTVFKFMLLGLCYLSLLAFGVVLNILFGLLLL